MEYQEEVLKIFKQESLELISSIDNRLLSLEKKPHDKELLVLLFRDIHSLKGSCRMLGFVGMQDIAHKMEDVISLIKENKLDFNSKIADTLSKTLSHISMLVGKVSTDGKEFKSKATKTFIDKLEKITQEKNESIKVEPSKKLVLKEDNVEDSLKYFENLAKEEKNEQIQEIYRVIIKTLLIFKIKNKPIAHNVALNIEETLKDLASKNADYETILKKNQIVYRMLKFEYSKNSQIKAQTVSNQREILNSITNLSINTLKVDATKLDSLVGQIRELIVSKIKTNEQLSIAKKIKYELEEWQKSFSKMEYYIKYFDKRYLTNPYDFPNWDYRTISAYNKQLCALAQKHTDRISSVINQMQTLFSQIQEGGAKLNTTTNEIETMVKNMRILPLSVIFQFFPRMISNIAKEKNKLVDVVIKGDDVTADKTIIEEIKIPLMHIVRNAIDHGIEDVKTREKSNKNPTGKIEIQASYQNNKVIIDIKDDGRGIDIEKIKQKALEMRLLTFDEIENIDEDELLNLIFYPGFSTEKFVTELSGRGLGLDIVNNKIKQLQGKIDVFSKLKEGTLVRLTLPATIATKKVFVIQDKNQLWGIETSVIKTIVRIGIKEIQEKGAYNYYIYNNIPIKIYALSKILNFENDTDEEKLKTKYTLMILELNNEVFGIIVEKVISDQEIILKRLEAPLYHVDNILGITTLANGKPCLILNITEIASLLNSKKQIEKIVTKNQIETTKKNSEYNIMIVDDVKVTRILQKNILTSQGFNTQIYASPALALKKLRQEKFHLVVTDINMPEMNGFEFVEQLRRLKEYKNCPVLVLSSDDINLHQAQIQEFDLAYIQKRDFNQHIFIDTVNKLLSS